MRMRPTEETRDDSKDRFYEELQQGFNHFLSTKGKFCLGDFNTKYGRENIFKPTIANESLQ